MATARVTYDSVVGAYDIKLESFKSEKIKEIIAVIKQFIPASYRAYNPVTKVWTIAETDALNQAKYWEFLKPVLEHHDFRIILGTKKIPLDASTFAQDFFYEQAPAPQTETAASIAQKLSTFLGVEIKAQELTELKRLYRQKARELHPDLGGDAAKMSELNRLWTLYTQEGVQ